MLEAIALKPLRKAMYPLRVAWVSWGSMTRLAVAAVGSTTAGDESLVRMAHPTDPDRLKLSGDSRTQHAIGT